MVVEVVAHNHEEEEVQDMVQVVTEVEVLVDIVHRTVLPILVEAVVVVNILVLLKVLEEAV
jgi:hypothetical protein